MGEGKGLFFVIEWKIDSRIKNSSRRDLKGRQCLWWVTETAEDISPYATFQLSEGGGGSLAGLGGLGGLGGAAEASAAGLHPNNTLLHSFMYHEHAMTEGCASPPPAATVSVNWFRLIFKISKMMFNKNNI